MPREERSNSLSPILTVVLGGARSGKSSLAVRRGREAEATGRAVAFVATSPRIPGDADLDARIDAHRAERPPTWRTIEEEVDLANAIRSADPDALVIVDCVTLWVSNLMHRGETSDGVITVTHDALSAVRSRPGPSLLISNEVGMGIVPMNEIARSYRDILGRVNQVVVAASHSAFLMVAGRALPLVGAEGL